MIERDDVGFNPLRNDIFVVISIGHRDKILLIHYIPCVCLVTFQEQVPSVSVFKPVAEAVQIRPLCPLECANCPKATQCFVFDSWEGKLVGQVGCEGAITNCIPSTSLESPKSLPNAYAHLQPGEDRSW